MLEYLLSFSENYSSVSRLSYVHLNTAHEGSGTVISSLDKDLKRFLEKFVKRNERSVVFLMGDHGMRYGAWFTQVDGSHEHRLPALFVISSEDVLKDIDNSREILKHNTARLAAKLDLHTTLVDLSEIGSQNNTYLENVCNTSKRFRSYSLFREPIPDTRTCMDANIPSFWCSCMPFEDIQLNSQEAVSVRPLLEQTIWHINAETVTAIQTRNSPCQKLALNSTLSIQKQTTPTELYYKLKFNTLQSKTVTFEALVLINRKKIRKRLRDGFGSSPFFFFGRGFYRIMYIKRLDAYAGFCKDISLLKNIDPMLCVCYSKDYLRFKDPVAVEIVSKNPQLT